MKQVLFEKVSMTNMRRCLAAGLLLLCCIIGMPNAQALKIINVSDDSLADLQKKIDKLEKALDNTKEQKQAAAEALKASDLAISESNKKLDKIAQDTENNIKKQAELSAALEASQTKLNAQKVALSKQLYHQYTLGQQDYLQLILQESSPAQHSRDMAYFSYIAKAHTKTVGALQQNVKDLHALNAEIEDAMLAADTLKAAQEAQQVTLKKQKEKKAKVVALLSSKADKQRSAIEKLKQDEQNLTRLMVKLNKEAEKKKKQAKKQKKIAINQHEPAKSRSTGKPFKQLKGKLRLPVKGRLLHKYGQQRTETGITWKGLFIKAKEGAKVKSIAEGKVVFSNWMRGFGNLIIVDHGQGYMSLYGNNESLFKSVGETVNGGDDIAAVGNSGGNENTGLYYELRKKSKPFNPLPWSKL